MRTKTNSPWTRLFRAALFSLVPLAACSGDKAPRKGQIMLAVQTDMSIPEDVTHVRIIVQKNGALKFDTTYEVGPGGQEIPATLGLIASDDPEDTVEVRVLGYQRGTARTLSRAVTTIPQERIATLHVPIQWLCWNQVTATQGVENSFDSSCEDPDQACVAGTCEDVVIDSDTLPDFRLEDVQGGSEEPTEGVCLDTVACFDLGLEPAIGPDCTISVSPAEIPRLNVALVLATERGICSEESGLCYVPLDRDERYGWRVLDGASAGGEGGAGEGGATGAPSPGAVRVKLPNAVCQRIAEGEASGVRVTSVCTTKTSAIPTCGPWTSIGTENPNVGPITMGPGPSGECPALATPVPVAPIAEDPEIDRFARLALELSATADRVRTDVGRACSDINATIAQSPTDFAGDVPTDTELEAACDAAVTNIGSAVTATLAFGRGYCRADTAEQLSLEAGCPGAAACDSGGFTDRCSLHLTTCDGTCGGPCLPSGNDFTVECDGFCSGQCVGTCEGSCTGPGGNELPSSECMGLCSGSCIGTCQGDCAATTTCAGTCSGSCDGAVSDEACEHPLTLAECAATSACENLAAATAGLHQTCRGASVLITGETPPNVAPAIGENYPKLMLAMAEGHGLTSAIGSLGAASSALSLGIAGDPQNQDAACLFEALNLLSLGSQRFSVALSAASRVLGGVTSGGPSTDPACIPAVGEHVCNTCAKTSCCAELTACAGDARCSAELECGLHCLSGGGTRETCDNSCAVLNATDVFDCVSAECSTLCTGTPPAACFSLPSNALIDDFDDFDTFSPYGNWEATPGTSGGPVLVGGMTGAAGDFGLGATGPNSGVTLTATSCLDVRPMTALVFHAMAADSRTSLEVRIRTKSTEPPALGGNCVPPACGDYYYASANPGYMFFYPVNIPFSDFLNSQLQPVDSTDILAIDFVSTATSVGQFSLDEVSVMEIMPPPIGL